MDEDGFIIIVQRQEDTEYPKPEQQNY